MNAAINCKTAFTVQTGRRKCVDLVLTHQPVRIVSAMARHKEGDVDTVDFFIDCLYANAPRMAVSSYDVEKQALLENLMQG